LSSDDCTSSLVGRRHAGTDAHHELIELLKMNSPFLGSQLLYRHGQVPAMISGQAIDIVADKSDFEQLGL
jgi:hypothetical protein